MGASQSAADPKGSAPGRAAGVVSQRQRPSSGTGSSVLAQATGVEAVPDHTRRACVREMSCSSAVWSVRLSADSTWIVTGDESRRVIIWDALKAAKVREMECDGQVTAVDILADGSSVVSGDLSGHVCVWDATSGALRHRLNSDAPISAVQVSRDMALVLSADESGAVRLWQVASGAAHGEAMHCRASVNCACLTVDVSLIVTADKAPCLSIWEVCDSTSPHTRTLPGQCVTCHGTTLRRLLTRLTARARTCAPCMQVSTRTRRHAVNLVCEVLCMHLASDSSTLATGGDDGIVRLWDAQTGEQAQVDFRCHSEVTAVQVSHDRSILVSGDCDARVRVWDAFSGEELTGDDEDIHIECGGIVNTVDLALDKSVVASGDETGKVGAHTRVSPRACARVRVRATECASARSDAAAAALASSLTRRVALCTGPAVGGVIDCAGVGERGRAAGRHAQHVADGVALGRRLVVEEVREQQLRPGQLHKQQAGWRRHAGAGALPHANARQHGARAARARTPSVVG